VQECPESILEKTGDQIHDHWIILPKLNINKKDLFTASINKMVIKTGNTKNKCIRKKPRRTGLRKELMWWIEIGLIYSELESELDSIDVEHIKANIDTMDDAEVQKHIDLVHLAVRENNLDPKVIYS